MNMQRMFLKLLPWSVCLSLVLANPVYALPPLSNNPLFQGGNISPNVMFTLDDSGSMQWDAMPDSVTYFSYLYPRPSGLYGGTDYANHVPDFDSANIYNALMRSPYINKIYYDPAVTYDPWSNQDGTLMPVAVTTCAYHNPKITALGCRNLEASQTVNMSGASWWYGSGGWYQGTHTFYPAVYYRHTGGSIWSVGNYTEVQIISTTPSYTGDGRASRTDCTLGTCTYAQEIQNFANWYTYYRSRILLARAGVGKAFAAQGNNMRVGFAAINKGSTSVDGVATSVVVRGVRQFTGADRTTFFNDLYDHVIPTSGTPLRTALNRVGGYYERTDDNGPWGEFPGTGGGTQHECRQNYNILMTDGYWNDSFTGIGNSDGTAGTSISNDSTPAVPPSYAYAPSAPYTDTWSNTLADVAMHYWKRDLRPTLPNKVPINASDPAFWQHMVTFTAGLGVSGTLPPPPAPPGAWPDPTLGNPEKLDDLWHAGVNGRGDFFSAANPKQFANGLSAALGNINARTGSASAVATNSTKLEANGRVYQAKFNNGDWSGQLLAYPIVFGILSSVDDWDAGSLINALAPASRIIISKGSSDGVEFLYGTLSAAQKAELDKNAAGVVDNCGPERVAYLRGDAVNEGISGTFTCASSIVIDKFRNRATSKLGDIVNSGPFYVGAPSAGHSDVDHAGYAAFSGSSTGYQDRMPMVYVGANDGSLHGFNACTIGVTPGCTTANSGKELIAYIPSMVYANLSRLTDKSYNANHRYFVDGSPMVADANLGTTAIPDWKTVLVGSMNGGGQGYFALDVTNPADGAKTAPTFTAANAASLLLWEFTSADDADMGYTHNLPPLDLATSQAKQIVKMENGKWAVIVGNGYNSASGKAVLYVLFIQDGVDGAWTLGTDYIRLEADSVGPGNGLSTPVPFDSDGNGLMDVVYAGDLKGNLWKFDVSAAAPASWSVALGGAPLFAAGPSKSITAPPAVSLHPSGGQQVLFGTGRYLETGDVTSTGTQSLYGIWDNGATVTATTLIQQTATLTGTVMTTSLNAVNYSTVTPVVKGWYMNLPVSGERTVAIPSLEDGFLSTSSIIPSTSPCDGGGKGYPYYLDFLTGQMSSTPAFDTNGDGVVDGSDSLSSGVEIGFTPGGITRIRGATQTVLVYSKSDGTLVKIPGPPPPLVQGGRINWRELIQ